MFVYVLRDNLLGIMNYIDQYIEHDNIDRVQRENYLIEQKRPIFENHVNKRSAKFMTSVFH